MEFLSRNATEIARMTMEHVWMVGLSVTIAALIALPLGVYCTRNRRVGRIVLRVIDAIQTIPSLALFGFLIPIPLLGGIGMKTAIVALVLYSILPILRNTVIGIEGVDPVVREAGVAMGLTQNQLLREVELPLAMPSIVGGIRLATVIGIGVATIAAAIGGGGLGTFIFRGIAMVDSRLLLAGAVPAALLAWIADLGLSFVERRLTVGEESSLAGEAA